VGDLTSEKHELVATLEEFPRTNGFVRGIAGPQIGILKRFIALNLGEGPQVLTNPSITWKSDKTMELWEDCMSLPWNLCKVSQSRSISVELTNDEDEQTHWVELDEAVSELLQHEIDHLDGILITDR
jgi:peptide deformylase